MSGGTTDTGIKLGDGNTYECTGPLCGKLPQSEKRKVKTKGTYCSECGKKVSSELIQDGRFSEG